KEGAPVVVNFRRLAVHQVVGAHDFAAERLADGLMPEADAQDRNFAFEPFNEGKANAGLIRRTRPRGQHDVVRPHRRDLVQSDFVVAPDNHFFAQFSQVLDQVVGEGIVIVDDQNHGRFPRFPSAPSVFVCAAQTFPAAPAAVSAHRTAFHSASALWRHSRYSRRGSESITMPAPVWIWATPSRTVTVRIIILNSILPE